MLYTDSMETETKPHRKRPAKQSATVRISEQSHQHLRELAAQSGEPMQAVMQKFLEECHTAYCKLQQDPAAWADYQQELAAWEVTNLDGLEPEEDERKEVKHG